MELTHRLALAACLLKQLLREAQVTATHGEVAQYVARGDPGRDAASAVSQGVVGRPFGGSPVTSGPLDVPEVCRQVAPVVPELDGLGICDSLSQELLRPVVIDEHRGARSDHPKCPRRSGLSSSVLGPVEGVLDEGPTLFRPPGEDEHRAERRRGIELGLLVSARQTERAALLAVRRWPRPAAGPACTPRPAR